MTAVSASPWDSPAVRKRNAPPTSPLPRSDRRQGHAGAALAQQDRRRDEYHELPPDLVVLFLLEEPAEDRDIAKERYLAHRGRGHARRDAADDQAVAFLDEHLGFRLAPVDGRYARRDDVASGVVLHDDEHLDLGEDDLVADLLPDHGRRHFELEHRLLELDLRASRANRSIRYLF